MSNIQTRIPMPPGRRATKRPSRWRVPLIIGIGILIIGTALGAADLLRGNSALAVEIEGQSALQIDLNQSVVISPYLLGSNVFPRKGTSSKDQGGSGFMSYDQQVISGLRSAHIKLLRFPGGNWGEEHTPSATQLNDFSNLLNQVDAEGMMQAQLSDPLGGTAASLQVRANRAALLVDYMNNRASIQRADTQRAHSQSAPFHAIKYWTIGNEPDLLTNPDTNKRYTVEEYTQAFITYSLAMHEKDPGIKIFGPEISQYQGKIGPKDAGGKLWMETFLQEISSYEQTHSLPFHLLDGVSLHRYPFEDARRNTEALLNNPAEWDSILPSLREFVRQQFRRDLPIAITEINSNPGQNVPPRELAALWWADTLGKLMSNQVEYVAFFSTEGVDTPYPLFTKDLKDTAMLHTMQVFAGLQHNLIPIQGATGLVSVYATQNSEQTTVSLLLINKATISQRVMVHSASFLPVGPWQNADLTIQPHSIMVLTLHRGGSNDITN